MAPIGNLNTADKEKPSIVVLRTLKSRSHLQKCTPLTQFILRIKIKWIQQNLVHIAAELGVYPCPLYSETSSWNLELEPLSGLHVSPVFQMRAFSDHDLFLRLVCLPRKLSTCSAAFSHRACLGLFTISFLVEESRN